MKLEIIYLDNTASRFRKMLNPQVRWLETILKPKGDIEIFVVSGRRMHRLNKQFLGKDRSTNVLSFPKPKKFPGPKWGEIFLDPAYIRSHQEDLSLMLVHGILHVLGYDHKTKRDRIKMEKREQSLLKGLKHVA